MADDVIVVIGAGGIGIAIARRQGFGKTVLLADFNEKTLHDAAEEMKAASYSGRDPDRRCSVAGVGARAG